MQKEKVTPLDNKAALEAILEHSKGIVGAVPEMRLLEALSRYAITTLEARRYFDIYDCPALVFQLRKQGHQISKHWQIVIAEAGEDHRVGLYLDESGAGYGVT
ncbi:Helix-turn-helix domain containing protein [Comamonadaceae bacterium]